MKAFPEENSREFSWIIDIFPKRVSREFADRFALAETWFRNEYNGSYVLDRKLHFLLKLGCYMRFQVYVGEEEETPIIDPAPSLLKELLEKKNLTLAFDHLRITSDFCDTYMTLYTETEEVPDLLLTLSPGEGLYLWHA